jgi:uncharacterized protein with PIN domain
MKLGKLSSREKARPEEAIACPYCGYKNQKRHVENSVVNQYAANWMGMFRCYGCRRNFWVVGQYGEIRHLQLFSDISLSYR